MPEVGNGKLSPEESSRSKCVTSRSLITALFVGILFWVAKASFKREVISSATVRISSTFSQTAIQVSTSAPAEIPQLTVTVNLSTVNLTTIDLRTVDYSAIDKQVDSLTQSPRNSTWLELVKWEDIPTADPGPFLSRFRAIKKEVISTHSVTYPSIGLVRMEPTCLQQGTGWISHGIPLLTVPVDLEINRKHTPVVKPSPFQGHILSSESEWAYVGLVSSYGIDTLFHLIWAHLVIYRAFFKLQDTYKTAGTLFINPWSDGKHHIRDKPNFFTGMYAAMGEMFPTGDFGGDLGEIVCFKNGYMGGEKVYKTARGSISTIKEAPGERLAKLLSSRFKISDPLLRSQEGGRSNQRILLVERKTRKLVNLPEVREWCVKDGLLCSSAYLELMTLSEQFSAIQHSDIVLQIHGSSMSWMLFSYPQWKVWIEVLPYAGGSSSKIYSPNNMIVANSGKGTYGLLQRLTHTNYMGWLDRNVSNVIEHSQCKKTNQGTGKPEFWKLCSMRLDKTIFRSLIAVAHKYKLGKIPNGKLEFFLPNLNLDDAVPWVQKDTNLTETGQ